jgi:hypothetical protein
MPVGFHERRPCCRKLPGGLPGFDRLFGIPSLSQVVRDQFGSLSGHVFKSFLYSFRYGPVKFAPAAF